MMAEHNKFELSAEVRAHMDKWLQRYPADQRRSGVLEALRIVQEQHDNSLTTDMMDAVADYLGIARIAVYEVATFYSLYFLQPMGKYVIDVCTNISCSLNNVDKVVEQFKKRLGIDFNETTADGKFSLREVECLGACVAPPVCQIGKKYYENLSPEKVDAILGELK